ncbi:MAG: 50S ribosomal protein L30 [Salinibacter sp.]
MGKITIKQVRSTNGERTSLRRTLRALGLRRIRDTVTHEDTSQIRGMIKKVNHLVEVEDAGD